MEDVEVAVAGLWGMPMPIQYHVQRALDERIVASDACERVPTAIHLTLADMHEQAAAAILNQRLAPFETSPAWMRFAR